MENTYIDFRAAFATLRRQIWVIVLTLVLCLAIALAFLFAATPHFRATALILTTAQEQNLLEPERNGILGMTDANARVESEVEILRSDFISLLVVRDTNLISSAEFGPQIGLRERAQQAMGLQTEWPSDPNAELLNTLDRFMDATDIRRRGATNVIEVSVMSQEAQQAADLANALAETYIDEQLSSKINATLAARDVLQAQISEAQTNLVQAESALDAFVVEQALALESNASDETSSGLAAALARNEASRQRAEAELQASLAALEERDWTGLVSSLEDDVLMELERQRADLERRLAIVDVAEDNGRDLQAQFDSIDARLEMQVRERVDELEAEIEELAGRQERDLRELRTTLVDNQISTEVLTQLYSLQQNSAVARSQYDNLLFRLNEMETRAGLQVADSRIVSPALVPHRPTFPNASVVLGTAVILGLFFGLMLAFLREYVIGGITSSDQLQDAAGLRVVASVPRWSPRRSKLRSPSDLILQEPLSDFSEVFRSLRAAIDFTKPITLPDDGTGRPLGKTILVTSSIAEEGKTTTALSLARTYALAGRRVVLIDADMRKPSMRHALGVETEKGLYDFLKAPDAFLNLKEISVIEEETNLTVVIGAPGRGEPTDVLLSSPAFEKVLSEARETFDVVILDAAPILKVADVRYLVAKSNVILVVVKWGATQQNDVLAALEVIRDLATTDQVLLTVLNQRQGKRTEDYGYEYARPGQA
jgi:succinoglycan biosynthesis transport protein ExoP